MTDRDKTAREIGEQMADLAQDLTIANAKVIFGDMMVRFRRETAAEECEACAKLCDESEAEGSRLRDEVPPQRGEPQEQERLRISRTSWVNTARSLASEIRARKMKAAEGRG